MGEKGSIKNLYKAWRLFLEEKKKKKKQKKKKPSKIKVFVVTFFTFLLSPFFFSGKKEYKKSIKQIELLVSEIEKENNPEILGELKDILKKEKEEVKKSKLIEVRKNKKIKLIEKAEEKIEAKIEVFNKEPKEETKSKNEKVQESPQEIIVKQVELVIEPKTEIPNVKPIIDIKDPDILEFLNYMKLEINALEYKLKGDLNKFQLKYLKTRIEELTDKRNNFKSNYDFELISEAYKTKDKYHILKNNDVLESLYKDCISKLEKVDSVKQEEKKKQKRVKEQEVNIEELKKINKYLAKQIKKQTLQISKLKLLIYNTEKRLRKQGVLMNIKTMLGNSFRFCFGLFPLSIFKNRLISDLVNSFMFNNSIRSIRNLINEEQIEYAKLTRFIYNQKDLIFNTRLVYEDALMQIEFLKYDLLSRFSYTDLKDVFLKLYELTEELKRKNKILSDLEIELEEQYENKIKRLVA